ncbi:hypothetical protein ABZ408_27210 [Streptomyces tibetensis]|uniref:hypothetical protein n=1 Tax=Streptomyces tibetensis TaxID=2382123 RepID=UPI0034018F94
MRSTAVNRLPQALNALVERLDTPAPIVPADVMRDSIDRTPGFATEHSLDVRPHVKTRTCVEIGRRQVKAGAPSERPRATWVRRSSFARGWVGVENAAAIGALPDAMPDDAGRLEVVIGVGCGACRSGRPPEVVGDLALDARKRPGAGESLDQPGPRQLRP